MSNNKQSSVEWLYDKIILKLYKLQKIEYTHIFLEELEQAKAMHEQEITDAHTTGYVIGGGNGDIYEPKQYYNETYGGNKWKQMN